MRAHILVLLVAALASSGCIGAGSVRTVLVDEEILLPPDAPASAQERLHADFRGCAPGVFDEEARRLSLVERETVPRFVLVDRTPDHTHVLAAGSGPGPLHMDLGLLEEQGSGGSWGLGAPFADAEGAGFLAYDKDGPTFNGQELDVGEPRDFEARYHATWDNVTFELVHRFHVTYLGRVAYDESLECDELT